MPSDAVNEPHKTSDVLDDETKETLLSDLGEVNKEWICIQAELKKIPNYRWARKRQWYLCRFPEHDEFRKKVALLPYVESNLRYNNALIERSLGKTKNNFWDIYGLYWHSPTLKLSSPKTATQARSVIGQYISIKVEYIQLSEEVKAYMEKNQEAIQRLVEAYYLELQCAFI